MAGGVVLKTTRGYCISVPVLDENEFKKYIGNPVVNSICIVIW